MNTLLHWLPSSLVSFDGILIFWLVGSDYKKTWLVALFGEVIWIAYAIWEKQYGFLIAAFFYTIVYLRNHLRTLHA